MVANLEWQIFVELLDQRCDRWGRWFRARGRSTPVRIAYLPGYSRLAPGILWWNAFPNLLPATLLLARSLYHEAWRNRCQSCSKNPNHNIAGGTPGRTFRTHPKTWFIFDRGDDEFCLGRSHSLRLEPRFAWWGSGFSAYLKLGFTLILWDFFFLRLVRNVASCAPLAGGGSACDNFANSSYSNERSRVATGRGICLLMAYLPQGPMLCN